MSSCEEALRTARIVIERSAAGWCIADSDALEIARALIESEAENAKRQDLLVDVFDLWDDNAIEHSTPDNYQRAKLVFGWIFDELPPEKQAAIRGREVPDA